MSDILEDLDVVARVVIEYPKLLNEEREKLEKTGHELKDIAHFIEFGDVSDTFLKELAVEQRKIYQRRRVIKDRIKELVRVEKFVNNLNIKPAALEKLVTTVQNEVKSVRYNKNQNNYHIRERHDLQWLLQRNNTQTS